MTTATKLHGKLVEVAEALDWIPKGGHNEKQNYDYTRQADVAAKLRKELAQRHITLLPKSIEVVDTHDYQSASGGRQHFLLARFAWAFTDAETGETEIIETLGAGTDSGDKSPYKAMTGASKYAALLSFLIPTGDDPEIPNGTDSTEKGAAKPTGRGRQPQVAPQKPVPQSANAEQPPDVAPPEELAHTTNGKPERAVDDFKDFDF